MQKVKNVLEQCDICDCRDLKPKYKKTNFHSDIVQCNNCGLVFSNPQVEIFYNTNRHFEKYIKQETGRRLTANWRLDQIENFIKPGRLLEIGSAGGLFLDEARKRGWDVTGTEISINAIEYARNKLHLKIFNTPDLAKVNFENKFDVVVLLDMLEHIAHPHQLLEYINNKVLKDGGFILVEVPYIFPFYAPLLKFLRIPNSHLMFQHYYYYTKKTFANLASKNNFNIMDFKYGKRNYHLEYCVNLLFKRNKLVLKIITGILKKIHLDKKYVNIGLHEFLFYICKKS